VHRLDAIYLGALLISGCGAPAATPSATPSPPAATVLPTALTPANPTAAAITSPIVGSWHRAQTCEEMLAAFEAAGLAESHRDWMTGNFFGGQPGPTSGDPCAGAQGPLEHSHFFTAQAGFGSHDQNGEQVDEGDYAVADEDTLEFPSHATDFGYDGDLVVDYAVADGVAMFEVVLPDGCVDECADAYAWALSAFASGPWLAGEVP
jgi:hypothetical protein